MARNQGICGNLASIGRGDGNWLCLTDFSIG
jgi:hypothetical protein